MQLKNFKLLLWLIFGYLSSICFFCQNILNIKRKLCLVEWKNFFVLQYISASCVVVRIKVFLKTLFGWLSLVTIDIHLWIWAVCGSAAFEIQTNHIYFYSSHLLPENIKNLDLYIWRCQNCHLGPQSTY